MNTSIYILLGIILLLALIFDFLNGVHDASNSIATIVSTKVLTPFKAVLWAAFFNVIAFFISKYIIGEFKIADSVAAFVNREFISLNVIICGLVAAITWNLITWRLGIPSSSSHTLIGGFMGAAVAQAGGFYLHGHSVVNLSKAVPIFLFIFIAPFIGFLISFIISILTLHIFKRVKVAKAEKVFKRIQLASSAALSLGHGGNDAQKAIGIIGAAFIFANQQRYGHLSEKLAFNNFISDYWWLPLLSFFAMGSGTLFGGWRIVKTLSTKITKITSMEGVCAETAGAISLYISEKFGIPVSTTHTLTGAIIGVGATKRISAVRWGVTIQLVWAWILTIPLSAILAMLIYYIFAIFRIYIEFLLH